MGSTDWESNTADTVTSEGGGKREEREREKGRRRRRVRKEGKRKGEWKGRNRGKVNLSQEHLMNHYTPSITTSFPGHKQRLGI